MSRTQTLAPSTRVYNLSARVYYKPPTLRHAPTSRIRGLNIKGPGARPRGRGIWRPQEKKTQPTATASTGAKRSFKAEMPKNTRNIPSANARLGPEETASTGGLNRNYIALNVWRRAAASNLQERPETARNGRKVFLVPPGRRPAERKFITFYYW